MLSIIYKVKGKDLNAKKFRNILNESKLAYIIVEVICIDACRLCNDVYVITCSYKESEDG